MPSKLGFGNSRTPMTKKASYGSAMHYKNPVKLTENAKTKIMASDANPEFKAAISKATVAKMYGKSPAKKYDKSPVKKDTGEVVSKNSPGPGWTKTKGTNIWAPPVADKQMLGQKKGRLMKDSIKKVARPSKKSTITDNTEMKPPYKKPVGPRA